MLYKTQICILILIGILFGGCKNNNDLQAKTEIAVTNSYLECAVKDIFGADTEILVLAPPGMCPGHFDFSPAQAKQLKDCKLLLLFDFQQQIEDSLSGLKDNGLKTASVTPKEGLCIPDTYLAVCRDVAEILSLKYPDRQALFSERQKIIEERMNSLTEESKEIITNTSAQSTNVLASMHQSEFADWLGMQTVKTFIGSDIETMANINTCLGIAKEEHVKFIIANKQEGTSLAEVLSEQLSIPLVVFSNFPEIVSGVNGFDELFRANIQNLAEAAKL